MIIVTCSLLLLVTFLPLTDSQASRRGQTSRWLTFFANRVHFQQNSAKAVSERFCSNSTDCESELMSCLDGRCRCMDGYIEAQYGQMDCLKLGLKLGDSCVQDVQCDYVCWLGRCCRWKPASAGFALMCSSEEGGPCNPNVPDSCDEGRTCVNVFNSEWRCDSSSESSTDISPDDEDGLGDGLKKFLIIIIATSGVLMVVFIITIIVCLVHCRKTLVSSRRIPGRVLSSVMRIEDKPPTYEELASGVTAKNSETPPPTYHQALSRMNSPAMENLSTGIYILDNDVVSASSTSENGGAGIVIQDTGVMSASSSFGSGGAAGIDIWNTAVESASSTSQSGGSENGLVSNVSSQATLKTGLENGTVNSTQSDQTVRETILSV